MAYVRALSSVPLTPLTARVRLLAELIVWNAGMASAVMIPMIAITTISSIKVNADRSRGEGWGEAGELICKYIVGLFRDSPSRMEMRQPEGGASGDGRDRKIFSAVRLRQPTVSDKEEAGPRAGR